MGINHSASASSKNGLSRNNSSAVLQEKPDVIISPSQKLAKLLSGKSLVEDSVQDNITLRVFSKYVFPGYQDTAFRVFRFMTSSVGASPNCKIISENDFVSQAEYLLGIISDKQISQTYVAMYGEKDEITQENLRDLLMSVYKLAMNYYAGGPQSCRHIFSTLQAVVESAFHKKNILKVSYVSNWLDEHCPHLVHLLHRFVTHMLSTAHHNFEDKCEVDKSPGIELTTPVLEKVPFNFESGVSQPLLPVSQVWLLAMSLPHIYTRPQLSPTAVSKPICAKFYLSKMLGFTCPSHWTLLYNSNLHGLGANRFIHHVSSYRGPTLTFIRGDQNVEFCLGATQEWKESHQYWGLEHSIILQILPLYHIVERGPKLMYINMSIRGYPQGIRAGSNPRSPVIDVNSAFSQVMYCGIPYQLHSVEVWGCGPPEQREAQLDVKKWEGKEIEKVRKVKLSADEWTNHPDRYLLELAGRPSYTSS